jgi:predicted heme/steroid binding protein
MSLRWKRLVFIVFVFSAVFFFSAPHLTATPEFAEQTEKSCAFCHDGPNGGPLTTAGKAFIRNGYSYPIPKRIIDKTIQLESPFHRTVRGILGYIHLITAAIFVGTIFFVHMFLKPRSLRGGIPGGEKKLGLSCMSILAASGIYLTWYRLDRAAAFFDSRFGVLLFIKILLFVLLLALGILAVTLINKRMRREAQGQPGDGAAAAQARTGSGGASGTAAGAPPDGFSIGNLGRYDGKEGRPAYVMYRNKVYDVTESQKWKEGSHFTQHAAGTDLTKAMGNAPHTEEVLSRFPVVAAVSQDEKSSGRKAFGIAQRIFVTMAYVNLAIVILILLCVGAWLFGFPRFTPGDGQRFGGVAAGGVDARGIDAGEWPRGNGTVEVTVTRGGSGAEGAAEAGRGAGDASESGGAGTGGSDCVACHWEEKPALVEDWRLSIHGKLGVACADCHKVAGERDVWVSKSHYEYTDVPVTPLVTPRRCARCHQEEVDQYSRSKHAHTLEIINRIDNWLIHGMNSSIERATGCFACHGSVVEIEDGEPVPGTWPNVGVGRKNPDGSLGSCTSCHTRHRFSIVEARKPEACDQCHLGPDHPQIEIYNESKHGTMYHAYGDEWTWRPEDFHWTAGRDYRAPTCAACHMSEAGEVEKSHDVTGRLAWELQAPLTIRPEEFTPYPADIDWRTARNNMRTVCLQCHSEGWTDGHFENMDTVIDHYNEEYFKPIKKMMDELYARGLLTEESYFDEELEWEYYELWHHEGRRARMGAAMMAPDYAWWHGFYECKHRFITLIDKIEAQTEEDRGEWIEVFPGRLEER